MKHTFLLFACGLALAAEPAAAAPIRNIVVFVADGLRYGSVTPETAPVMARLKTQGVDFADSHALYPTITTANASAIATGHYIGDTGDFGNTLYAATPLLSLRGSPVAQLESDPVLEEMNMRFGGNYLNEQSLIATARAAGFSTAVIGKEGPAHIQDVTAAHDGSETVIIDDATGHDGGIALPPGYAGALKQAFVPAEAPRSGVPDIEQEMFMIKAATRVVLPKFQAAGKPFVLLFWCRDPDYSQHNMRDSVGELDPGINGPSGKAGVRDADTMLGMLLDYLKSSGLYKNTDVFVTADHGFTTTSHASATSPSAHYADANAPLSDIPFGFLAIDLASGLGLPLYEDDANSTPVDFSNGARPSDGVGILGHDPKKPDVVVVPNGGADIIYLPQANAKDLAGDVVSLLAKQDYVSGIFVNDKLGAIPGTLPMSALNLMGSAHTPQPAIYVNFRSFAMGCPEPLQCTVEIADSPQTTGQGTHGSLSRAETRNFMAAIGPDFKSGFVDEAPISNADIAPTLAHLAGLDLPAKGTLKGRVITEALVGGAPVQASRQVIQSAPDPDGRRTILDEQSVGSARYFDAAGFEGLTVGLAIR